MSIRKKQANPDLRFHRFLVPAASDHLFQSYLLTKDNNGKLVFDVNFANILEKMIIITFVFKFSLSLWLGWDAGAFQKYFGDFYAAFNSKPIWLYLNSGNLACCLQDLILSLAFQRYFDQQGFEVFLVFSGIKSLSELKFGDNSLEKLLRKVNYIFKLMAWLKTVPYFFVLGFGGVFMWNQFTLDGVFIGFFWTLFCFGLASPLCHRIFSTAGYFVAFCLYASQRLLGQSRTIRLIDSIASRNTVRPRILSSIIRQTIADQMHLIRHIQSANRLYKRIVALYIPALTFSALVLLFGFQKANNLFEKLFLGFLLIIPLVLTSFYFLTAAMVSRAVKRCYLSWTVLVATIAKTRKLKRNLQVSVAQITSWHALLMLEYFSSKKFKVGFGCLHWFALTNWSLIRLVAVASSNYFFLVQFARALQP